MQAFQQNLTKLKDLNTQVVGVSMDSSPANNAWAQQIGVTFPLLSDWGGDVTREYGIYSPKYKAARRTTFLIDKQGKIQEVQYDAQALDPTNTVTSCERHKLAE
jgi:peroxiredoxin